MSNVTVVCGPPGGGKTTWVSEQAKPGDLRVDLDSIYQALSGLPVYKKPANLLPYVFAARDGALNCLEEQPNVSALIITTGAARAERDDLRKRFGAEVVVMETPAISCLERISQDDRRSDELSEWMPRVLRWWREYERSDADTIIKGGE